MTGPYRHYKKVVICLLHVDYEKYLLQLRDFKPDILYPGHWGAFGGAVETEETPSTAMMRELEEEIGFTPRDSHLFKVFHTPELELETHVFFARLSQPLSGLQLNEGQDLGLFPRDKIETRQLYSDALNREFPVAPPLMEFFEGFFEFIEQGRRNGQSLPA